MRPRCKHMGMLELCCPANDGNLARDLLDEFSNDRCS